MHAECSSIEGYPEVKQVSDQRIRGRCHDFIGSTLALKLRKDVQKSQATVSMVSRFYGSSLFCYTGFFRVSDITVNGLVIGKVNHNVRKQKTYLGQIGISVAGTTAVITPDTIRVNNQERRWKKAGSSIRWVLLCLRLKPVAPFDDRWLNLQVQ